MDYIAIEFIKNLLQTEACRMIEQGESYGVVEVMLRENPAGYKRKRWTISIKEDKEE